MLVPTPTIRKFVERPFRIIARHEMVISVSATIISKRELTVSNPEIIFNGITGEMASDAEGMKFTTGKMTSDSEEIKFATEKMTSDAEGMEFTTGKMTSEMSEMISVTREMKTDAVETTPTFAAVTTVATNQTIIIAKTY